MGSENFCLIGLSLAGPCDDVGGLDAALGEFVGNTAHFLDRPTDHRRSIRVTWLLGAATDLPDDG